MYEIYLTNQKWIWGVVMAVIVFAITYIVKLPIKALTIRLRCEKKRKAVNSVILLFPFIFGLLAQLVYNLISNTAFDVIGGLAIGTASITIYSMVERFFNNNSSVIEEHKEILDVVEEIVKDGQFDKSDYTVIDDAIKNFAEKLKT